MDYITRRPNVTVSEERKKQIQEQNAAANKGALSKAKSMSQGAADRALIAMGKKERPKPTPKSENTGAVQTEVPSLKTSAGIAAEGKAIKSGETTGKVSEVKDSPLEPKVQGNTQQSNEATHVFPDVQSQGTTSSDYMVEMDEFEDPELIPPAMWNTPAQDYWSTAEPANEEEKRTFHSKPFQQATLTMGLSLLLGNSLEDSMYTGMQAYAQSEYINTDEYAELVNSGVPEEVVRGAFNSGDWSQVKQWEKDIHDQKRMEQQLQMEQQKMAMQGYQFNAGQQLKIQQLNTQIDQFNVKLATENRQFGIKYLQEKEKALKESLSVSPNEYQKKIHSSNLTNFEKIRTEIQQTNKQMQYADKIIADLDAGNDVDNNMMIALLNSAQSVYDPKGTVKEGDVALMMAGLGIPSKFSTEIKKFFTTGVLDPNVDFLRSVANSTIGKGNESLNSLYSNVAGLSRSSTMAGIPEQYQPWRFDTTVRSTEKLDNLYNKHMGG